LSFRERRGVPDLLVVDDLLMRSVCCATLGLC
jgi:hypothetical protein